MQQRVEVVPLVSIAPPSSARFGARCMHQQRQRASTVGSNIIMCRCGNAAAVAAAIHQNAAASAAGMELLPA